MADGLVHALADQNFSKALKFIDAELSNGSSAQQLAQLHLNRGVCHTRLQLHRKALKDFEAALSAAPGEPRALYRRGLALQALRRPEEASAALAEALAAAGAAGCYGDLDLIAAIQAALSSVAAGPAAAAAAAAAAGGAPAPAAPAGAAAPGVSAEPAAAAATPPAPVPRAVAAAAAASPPAARLTSPAASSQPPASSSPAAASSPPAAPADGSSSRSKAAAASKPAEDKAKAASTSGRAAHAAAATAPPPSPAATAASGGASPFDPASALQLAMAQVNGGRLAEATALLDQVLRVVPNDLGALVTRGTALAMSGKLEEAVADFTSVIDLYPWYPDAYKRRATACSALGRLQQALDDNAQAIRLLPAFALQDRTTPLGPALAECHLERGALLHRLRDYGSAVAELQLATEKDDSNHSAWNLLGLCSTCCGDLADGVACLKRAVALRPGLRDGWLNLGQCLKELGRTAEAEAAFGKAMELDPPGRPSILPLRIMAAMRQGCGDHAGAIALLDKALGHGREELKAECLLLRAACHHALGRLRAAVKDYEACYEYVAPRLAAKANAGASSGASAAGRKRAGGDGDGDGSPSSSSSLDEGSSSACIQAFYQREIANYSYFRLDVHVSSFCFDCDLHPLFKELWAKKSIPTAELIAVCRFHPSPPAAAGASGRGAAAAAAARVEWGADMAELVTVGDAVGRLVHNRHKGFLPNRRMQRAAGLAVTELAQAVLAAAEARAAGRSLWVDSAGASGHGGCGGRHEFRWRDAMDIAVKWRQQAEPNDPVLWVDLLTRREFESGFGSHTPMFSGQTKNVRYYMNFDRALALHKTVLLQEGCAYTAANERIPLGGDDDRAAIAAATTASEMYAIIKQDSWVVVPIASVRGGGGGGSGSSSSTLEGTRLTLTRVPDQPDGYEFSIRTPVTPPRWAQFDAELDAAWEAVVTKMAACIGSSSDTAAASDATDLPGLADAILTYAYYWFNFMPLARGTALVGYVTVLALFWAGGMQVTSPIPADYQVDWEAILSQSPAEFSAALARWMTPTAGLAGGQRPPGGPPPGCSAPLPPVPPCNQVPAVSKVLATMRRRFEALNGEGSTAVEAPSKELVAQILGASAGGAASVGGLGAASSAAGSKSRGP